MGFIKNVSNKSLWSEEGHVMIKSIFEKIYLSI